MYFDKEWQWKLSVVSVVAYIESNKFKKEYIQKNPQKEGKLPMP